MIQKRNKFTSAMDCLVIYGLQLSANFTTHAAISLNALVHNHIYLTIFFFKQKNSKARCMGNYLLYQLWCALVHHKMNVKIYIWNAAAY